MLRVLQAVVILLAVAVSTAVGQKEFVVTGAGQGLSRLTSEKQHETGPRISPDGKLLLFDTRLDKESVIVGIDPNTGGRRTLFTAPTSRAEQVGWDPVGRFFVFSSNAPGKWSLVRAINNSANAAIAIVVGGEIAPLVSDPSLSPDGTRLAFSAFVRDGWSIGVANLDGSNVTFYGPGRDPAWGPANRVAFWKTVNGRAQIFTLNVDMGAELIQVTTGESDNVDPAWSPDGESIVFASNRGEKKAAKGVVEREERKFRRGHFNLFVTKADGTNVVQLTDGKVQAIMPDWGGDGWIYFTSNHDKSFDIWRLKPNLAQ